MGLIQSILAKATFKDNRGKFHLQNDSIRIEMNADEFIEFSSTIIDGANKLIETKKIKID